MFDDGSAGISESNLGAKALKWWLVVIGLIAALGILSYFAAKQRAAEKTSRTHRAIPVVTVVRPKRRDLSRRITLTGDVLGIKQADLTAKAPGFIEAIYVDRGDYVKRNQLLAVLTYPEQEKAYRQAKANFELAKANYLRSVQLWKEHVISQQDYDTALANYKSTKEAYKEQEALYSYRIIRAPFSGYIIQRNYDPGHLVYPGVSQSPLFVLADSSKVKIFVYVPEEDLGHLKIGLPAEVRTDAYPEKVFSGSVVRLAQGLDPSTRTMQTEVDLPNPENLLKPGMFARVTLKLFTEHNVLTLIPSAVLHGDQGSFVYVVKNAHAHKVAVKLGLQESDAVQIVDGLVGDEMVVSSGAELLDDGSPVRVAAVLDESKPYAAAPTPNVTSRPIAREANGRALSSDGTRTFVDPEKASATRSTTPGMTPVEGVESGGRFTRRTSGGTRHTDREVGEPRHAEQRNSASAPN